MTKTAQQIKQLVDDAKTIVIMQADNPDGDSLASALALEQIFHDMGKTPHLYCGVNIAAHLKYLPGWDRVSPELPKQFDLSIIVDTSSKALFEVAQKSGELAWVAAKPSIVLDHHDAPQTIDFAEVVHNDTKAVATGEVIYEIAKQLDWPLDLNALNMLAISILSDSLGLMTEATTARSIHIIAELVEKGVNLAELDNARRELMRKSIELVRYKGRLLERIEYHDNNRIAIIIIPWAEIEQYSHAYNPSMLVIDDMRLTEGVDVAIAFKQYKNNKVTAKIRTNYGKAVAGKLAEHFGGGGHPYAAGFKITDGRSLSDIKNETIKVTRQLLDGGA